MLLICIIAYQCVGFGWMHWWQIEAWRAGQWERLEARLEADEVQLLELADLGEVAWENAHEFDYHGVRYDVLSKERMHDGNWRLRCVMDEKETELKAKFEALMASEGQDGDAMPSGRWLKLVCIDYIATPLQLWDETVTENYSLHIADWAKRMDPFLGLMDRPPTWS